ncbi:MAG: glucose 1-dehydrogenase [Rhizobiales bacterium]|nr:glucose 1-dehydrogenase [Hyphomicrobiales bacterium]
MRLKDKVAIVTGAASGFGEGIARRFIAEGASVIVADIADEAGEKVAASLRDEGGKAQFIHADVTLNDQVGEMIASATSNFGKLDIVINNAGMPQRNQPALDVDEATFDAIFAVNCKSIYLATIHCVPVMREQGGGVILNMASSAGIRPRPGLTWYNGSKGAVLSLTKAMAIEFAADKIRVNALCPVAGDTPMLAEFLGGEVTNQAYANFVATVPLGRLSTPRDLANSALFLCSDEADFLTGVGLEVDGGRCI